MAIGSNITTRKSKQDRLIKKTEKEEQYKPGQPSSNPEADTYGTEKKLLYLKKDLYQKVNNNAYWDRTTITDIVNSALEEYLKGKNTRAIPEK